MNESVHYADQSAMSAEKPLRYELPHLAVDSADHNYSKCQQVCHLHMSPLRCLGSPAVVDWGAGALCEPVGKVSGKGLCATTSLTWLLSLLTMR
jgi:hypothetical protein